MGDSGGRGGDPAVIRTPDQRLRVFVSSTLKELADEREAVREAIAALRLHPVMFELGARPHPPRDLYRAYLAQSHVFIGIYWERYGWVAPGMAISGLEDEYRLAERLPKLIYVKAPAPDREPGLERLLGSIKADADVSYKYFQTAEELGELVAEDLALLLTERFERGTVPPEGARAYGRGDGRVTLPRPLTPLIGRWAEVEAVRALLTAQDVRLVTLTGPGGVGKTRLGVEVAAGLVEEFDEGIHWVPLGAIRTSELVLSAIARALDVRERSGTSLLESVKDYAQEKELLLVLDNFEQVLTAGAMLADLLRAAPKVKALVTSRASLRVRGERVFPVHPLALPDGVPSDGLERLNENASVRLFMERAEAVDPRFDLSGESAEAVVEIVRRLDGLPLAIELAAARVRLLPPDALLARLASRLDVLEGGAQDLPPRQQTLRKTIDWSYSLLDPGMQTLFARLGVFVGGFTIESAEVVSDQEGGVDVLEGIGTLLDNSLLVEEAPAAGEPRFGMLETIREYALERLAEAGEEATVRRRHARFFAELGAEAPLRVFSGKSEAWLDRLEADYDNFRAALAWLESEPESLELSGNLMIGLVWLWYRRGYLNEAHAWFAKAVAAAEPLGRDPLRGNILLHAGAIEMWRSDLDAAVRLMDEGVAILREVGEPTDLAIALFTRGVLAVNEGQAERARALLEEALDLCRQVGQPWFEAMSLLHLGNAGLRRGDVESARERIEASLALSKEVEDPWITASAANNLGEIARYEGDYAEAEGYYRKSRSLFEQVGSRSDVARETHSLGYVALSRGDYARARQLFEESLEVQEQLGVKRGVVEALAGLATVLGAQGAAETAVQLLSAAQAEFERLGAGMWPADTAEMERALGAARKALNEREFEAALEAGRRLELEEALGMVRSALRPCCRASDTEEPGFRLP